MTQEEMKTQILEAATKELTSHGHPINPETLYWMLCGMQDTWASDTYVSDEKLAWLKALRSLIHDQLHKMENE